MKSIELAIDMLNILNHLIFEKKVKSFFKKAPLTSFFFSVCLMQWSLAVIGKIMKCIAFDIKIHYDHDNVDDDHDDSGLRLASTKS